MVYHFDACDSDGHHFTSSDSRWDGRYRNDAIVVPMAEPEYVPAPEPAREGDTIYLK